MDDSFVSSQYYFSLYSFSSPFPSFQLLSGPRHVNCTYIKDD